MSEYTKGPWKYRPQEFDDWGLVRGGEMEYPVAVARPGCHLTEDQLNTHRNNKTDPYEANARLIAAAPELYEVLKRIVTDDRLTLYADQVHDAFNALAKAGMVICLLS